MVKEKVKNTISNWRNQIIGLKDNKTFLVCAFLTVVYLISGYWKWLEIAVSLFALVFMIILPLQSSFCVFLYVHNFTLSNISFDSCFMVTLIGYCLILFVKYCLGVKKGKYIFYKKLVCALSAFLLVSFVISCFYGFYRGAWLYLTYIPCIYLVYAMKDEFDIVQGMNYLFGGMVASNLLAIITLIFPGFQYVVFLDDRFHGFTNHPNYAYMRAMFVLAYYMYRYLYKDLTHLQFGGVYLVCGVITLATLSKTGIGMLGLMTLIFIVLYLKQDFKKNIKVVGVFAVGLVLILLVCYKFVDTIIDRFMASFESKNFWNSLLTGRDDIWKDYLYECFENPIKFLFGHGILSNEVFIHAQGKTRASHNLYIFMLYRFGLVGCIAIAWILVKSFRQVKTRPSLISYLPLIFILVESLFDNTFEWNHFTYFIFAVMILFISNNKENKEIENKVENSTVEEKKE